MTALVFRHANAIVAWTVLLAVMAMLGAGQLKLDQRLRALLPSDFPSVSGIDDVTERLGNQSDVYVTLRSPSRAANIELGDALAQRMAEMDTLSWVVFRRDYDFFEAHALLYLPLAQLLDLHQHVLNTIDAEVRDKAYGSVALRDPRDRAPSRSLSEAELRERYDVSTNSPEFFEADGGALMVIRARPSGPPTDLAFARALQTALEAVVSEVGPERFHPEMTVRLDGAFIQHTQRVARLEGDVLAGTAIALAALLGCITLYFRSARATIVVIAPVLVSAVATLAFAWVVFDALNIVSAFIFSILLGLGIDFGIHMLARYRHERARGHRQPTAWAITLATTGRSTAAAGLGTAGAFGTLSVASFRGFSQFGVLAAFGITAALAAALVVLPALVVVSERVSPWSARRSTGSPRARAAWKWPLAPAVVVLLVAIAGAAWSAGQLNQIAFEFDFGAMGPRPQPSTSAGVKGYRDAIGTAVTVAPAIAVADSPKQAQALYRQLSALNVMTPAEAAALVPLPTSRAPTLLEVLSPQQSKHPQRNGAPQQAPGDDWGESEDVWEDEGRSAQLQALRTQAQQRDYPLEATSAALGRYGPERRATISSRLIAVTSLSAFVPEDQDAKLAVIGDIRARVRAKRAWMSPSTRADLDEWAHYLAVNSPIAPGSLPAWVRVQFADAQGHEGRFVIAWTRGSKANYLNASEIYRALRTMQTATGDVNFAAEFFVLPEILDTIRSDAPVVLGLAFAAMLLTAWAALRSLGGPVAVAFVVGTSSLWLIGLMVALGWKLNYFNVVVLPLLLGMAQDDALHIYARWRQDNGTMGRVLRETGGAILLTTLTTICGFSGIVFADHRGLESMAWLAIVGMLLALVSAVVVLPALLQVTTWARRPGP